MFRELGNTIERSKVKKVLKNKLVNTIFLKFIVYSVNLART